MTIKVTYNVTDVYMTQNVSPVYINVSYSTGGGTSAAVWGSIIGTLSNQTDLQTALDLKVPYTGATANVNLGEYEIKAGQLTLDITPTGTAAVGTTRWNDSTGVSETTLKGGSVVIKNGVDLVARIVNKVTPNTTLTKAAYQAVRVSGAQGQRLAVALAQANNDANSADTIGLVTETIATNQEGFIMTVGQLEGINTTGSLQGETWVDGDVLYLSPTTAGAITKVKPTGAGHIVVIGYVEYAHQNNGKIYVKVMNGWELDELHDVDIVTPLNNEILTYESATSLWKNKSISTILGYTPEQPLTFSSPLARVGNVVSIPQATGSVNGFLSSTDWTTFNSKQAALGYTPANAATTLTINGVTFDLSTNRTWTISTGISGSGASGQVTYWTGASSVGGSNNLFWDNANGRLGIGTNAPGYNLQLRKDGSNVDIYLQNDAFNAARIVTGLNWIIGPLSEMTTISGLNGNAYGIFKSGSTVGIASYTTLALITQNVIRARLFNTGNFVIGSSIDNGNLLQISGSMTVSGDTTMTGSGNTSATTALSVRNSSSLNSFLVKNNRTTNIISDAGQMNIASAADATNGVLELDANSSATQTVFVQLTRGTVGFANTAINQTAVRINGGFAPTSGTATWHSLHVNPQINQTGGANGITRGLYVNPTLTSAADFRAIETARGNIVFANLPTSSAGLPSGALWNNGGVINIV